jgi:hypothetical protein
MTGGPGYEIIKMRRRLKRMETFLQVRLKRLNELPELSRSVEEQKEREELVSVLGHQESRAQNPIYL